MTPARLLTLAIDPALSLLPAEMQTPEARALLLAIALQESRISKRRQLGGGPARSYFQFEQTGIADLLTHHRSAPHLLALCAALDLPTSARALLRAIEWSDVLAVLCARLLLWTDPAILPNATDARRGWAIYTATWRPGRPRPETWHAYFDIGWTTVTGASR